MNDFDPSEFRARLSAAQTWMAEKGLDAVFICTEAEFRYFSGFRSQFWQSPTRNWFLILPISGEPIAVIPTIGRDLMQKTWVRDIRDFPAPIENGLEQLKSALAPFRRVGMAMSGESHLRMPLAQFLGLDREFIDCSAELEAQRQIKSPAEIALLRQICGIGSRAFSALPNRISAGMGLSDVFRKFKIELLEQGADDVPYLVGACAQGGYGDVISPPTAQPIEKGDVLMLDTGATLNGYFCDFDRNFSIGRATAKVASAHHRLWDATEAAIEFIKPGIAVAELFEVMAKSLGVTQGDVGRFGHGLGIQLTETPSIMPNETTILRPNMVLTLEPSYEIETGKMMVHEENLVVTDTGAKLLTDRAPRDIPEVE